MEFTPYLIALIIFFAVLAQTLSGFGMALVSMAILPGLIGIRTASPLVALIAVCIQAVILIRSWKSLSIRDIWLAILVSFIGVSLGVQFLKGINDVWGMRILGMVIAGYALYALSGLRLPKLAHPFWQALAGFGSGLLGGAFNTPGPPMIIYGDTQKWEPARFRSNLQGYFIINGVQVLANQALAGNLKPVVWGWFWPVALPALIAGLLGGVFLERYIPAQGFRRLVLILLVVTSLKMIFS